MNPRTLAPRLGWQSSSFGVLTALAVLASAAPAHADDPATTFVHAQQDQLRALLHQPASAGRDAQVTQTLSKLVDYDELTHRAFGEPCSTESPGCKDHWAELSDAQKAEVGGLLRRLVEKNYQKNINKTLDYDVTYQGASAVGGDSVVHTEATSISKPRDPAVLIDYVVKGSAGAYRVVDIVTEGSSLTKSYYDQFHRMLTTPTQGYAYIVKKLNDKIAQAN
jgi:phospholipid transport system substrate-binding protein